MTVEICLFPIMLLGLALIGRGLEYDINYRRDEGIPWILAGLAVIGIGTLILT